MHRHPANAFLLSCLSAAAALAVLALGLPAPAHAEGMTFEEMDYHGERAISAIGRITEETPGVFRQFLLDHKNSLRRPLVFLDSPGGIVLASMELGELLRTIGATAVVGRISSGLFTAPSLTGGACLSACVYTLIGARKRVVLPESEVGIHKMFLNIDDTDITSSATKRELAMAQHLRSALSSYAGRMGVSPEIIARAESTPSAGLHMLTRKEIKKWHLAVPNL